MRGAAGLVVVLAACAEPAVDMTLVLPKDIPGFDTSCITAVDVYADGADYPTNPNDWKRACIPIKSHPATFQALVDELRGKFEVEIPDSGLSGVEIYGYTEGCDVQTDLYDLTFFGSQPYIGQDTLPIPIVPNTSCTQSSVKVRLVDLMKLTQTQACANAAVTGANAGAYLGTLSPRPFVDGLDFYTRSGANAVNSVVTFNAALTIGPQSCLAVNAGDDTTISTSCISAGGPHVCSAPDEIEAPVIARSVSDASTDPRLVADFGPATFGAVWGTVGGTKQPLSGAVLTVSDPTKATVVYLDAPATTGALRDLGSQASGTSGMFAVYAKGIVNLTITANGKSMTIRIGAQKTDPGVVLVSMD